MRVIYDSKPASERPAQKDKGVLSVFRMPTAGSDADRLSGAQRSLARRKLGLATPGGVGERQSSARRIA